MGCVALLPADLASQIAAGEVVERPASALKELLENAVDAGASRCAVEIEGGGITRLSVLDDGCGMSRADATLSFQRHATSKLVQVTDLERLTSYGFRGEALPSIASVSRFTMRTRTSDQTAGTQLMLEGGLTPQIQSVGCAVGTLVEVRDLFFNVPARRKFLRSTGTESGHLTETVEAVALCRPHLALTLRRDGRQVRIWHRAEDRQERVRQSFEDPLFRCTGQRGPVTVEAFLSSAHRARNGAGGLKIVVNERPIKDRALAVAAAQAYGDQLERGRYPRGVIYLNLPPALVDFNVHPQKLELRFAEPRAVCDALYQVLRASLPQALAESGSGGTASPPREVAVPPQSVRPTVAPSPWHVQQSTAPRTGSSPWRGSPAWTRSPPSAGKDVQELAPPNSPLDSRSADTPTEKPVEGKSSGAETTATPDSGALHFVGVARDRYIVCESSNELLVLDSPATYEFFVRQSLRRALADGTPSRRALLLPVQVPMPADSVAALARYQPTMEALGLDLRNSEEPSDAITVHGLPATLSHLSPEQIVRTVLTHLTSCRPSEPDDLGQATLSAMVQDLAGLACAQRTQRVSATDAKALLDQLQAVTTHTRRALPSRCIFWAQPWCEVSELSP